MLKYFHFSLSEKIPLKTVIIVPFVLQIVAAVGLTGWLSFRNGQKAINDLVTQLQSEFTERIYQHLTTHTSMAHTANQINADAIHLGLLDLTDRKGLERHFWKQVQDLETVSYAGLGTPQATYVGAQALKDNSTLIEISDSTTANHLQIWNSNEVGERTQLTKNSPNYDPRKRPWYQTALKAKEAVWTDIYFSSRRTTLSANQPVYEDEEKKKNLLAVVTADLTLVEIGKFLRSLNLGNGQSLIIERSGLMVATSTNEKPYRITKAFQQQTEQIDSLSPERRYSERQNKVERFKAIDSQNLLTRAIAGFLNQHFGDLATIKNAETTFFHLNNEKYFLQIKPFTDKRGLDWLIVVVAPEADFIKPIDTNFYIMLILCLIALVIASWVGVVTAKWIVEPLWCLNLAASALARGEWQQQIAMEREDEVGELADSFNRMSKQLQELFTTLEVKNADLERLDKLKDEFLANTSHELRTPLNGIIGLAESLIDGATGQLSEATRSNLSMIVASGRRLSNLVNDILDFSKQKQNAIELDWQPVNLRIVTDIVLKICQPLVGQKPVQLINAIPPELPFAYADENRIQQILHNLIGNAIKFTEKGSVDISAQLIEKSLKDSSISQEESTSEKKLTDEKEMTKKTEQSLAHAQLVITVSDTGIGIPPNQTQKIFESFEQIAEAQTPSHHGTGLGLVVTQQLIALHGGTIWVDSVEGQGSRFSFTLPVAHPSALSTDSEAATATTLPSRAITQSQSHKQFPSYHQLLVESSTQEFKTTSLTTETVARTAQEVNVLEDTLLNYREDSKKSALFEQKTIKNAENAESEEQSNFTILIVDDEPVNLHVLANHLSLYNYVIIRASSGSDALATLEKGITPDLILLDVMMPHMTGYEVTQKIRERWEAYELPILLLTAKNQVADLVTGLEVGANDYLIKPISKNELLARIKTHLRIKELKEETLRLVIESERRLTQFLEAVPVGVFVTDANGHPYYANQKAQQLLGQGVKKETPIEELNAVYQIYLANTDQLYPNERQPGVLALRGESVTVDDMEIHQGDKIIPIEGWGTPIFDEKHNISYAMMAFQDITERRQAEAERERFTNELFELNKKLEEYSHSLEQRVAERTRKLQESENNLADAQRMALLGSWVWDIKSGTVIRSTQDCRNFKQNPDNYTSTYQAFIEKIHPEDKDIIGSMVEKCIIEGQTAEFEFRVVWPDGQIRTMRSQTELEFDAAGTPIRMKGFSQDITEQKEAEVKLQEAKQAAERALQQLQATQQQLVESEKMAALGNLVAGVAHEINTPIGIGVTATSRLETLSRDLNQKYQTNKMKRTDLEKYLTSVIQGTELILKNLSRAAELIQSFKQVAVDQSSERQRTFNLKEYLHEIYTSLRPEFKRTKHEVSIECHETITLSSYPGIFSQIFTNLIMNSLIHGFKETTQGHIKIIGIQDEKNLILRYSDNGKGIKPDIINQIFDPFFTTNRQGGGSGLGLHIVYNLVTHKLNGTIQCESIEGQGTTFIIQIPLTST